MDEELVPIGTPPPVPLAVQKAPATPVPAINHNVQHGGRQLHIQTEDLGPQRGRITTCVFVGGAVIATKSIGYAELPGGADGPDRMRKVRKGMQEQHKDLLRQLVRGKLDSPTVDSAPEPAPKPAPAQTAQAAAEHTPRPERLEYTTPSKSRRRWWIRPLLLRALAPAAVAAATVAIVVHLDSDTPRPPEQVTYLPTTAPVKPQTHVQTPTTPTQATDSKSVQSKEKAPTIAKRQPTTRKRARSVKRSTRALIKAGRRALARRNYKLARARARAALRRDRNNRSAKKLYRQAKRKIGKKRAAVRKALSSARRAYKARKYRLARKRARAVLRLDRRNRSALKLTRLASRKLRGSRT